MWHEVPGGGGVAEVVVIVVLVVVAVTCVVLIYMRWRRRYVYFNIKPYSKYAPNLSVYNSHYTLHYIL